MNQLTFPTNNCGDPLPPVPFGSQHYDIGHQRCATPLWWAGIRDATCKSRPQFDWVEAQR